MNDITKSTIRNFLLKNELFYKSTHTKLSLAIINRIYKKMLIGEQFESIKVNENLIIDGHHRYISAQLANIEIEKIKYPKTSATTPYLWG